MLEAASDGCDDLPLPPPPFLSRLPIPASPSLPLSLWRTCIAVQPLVDIPEQVPLSHTGFIIGRLGADLSLTSGYVSRKHAQLQRTAAGWRVLDTSTNGLCVNNVRRACALRRARVRTCVGWRGRGGVVCGGAAHTRMPRKLCWRACVSELCQFVFPAKAASKYRAAVAHALVARFTGTLLRPVMCLFCLSLYLSPRLC